MKDEQKDDDVQKKDTMTDNVNVEKLDIIKDPIIAFLIMKIKNDRESFYVTAAPITTDWQSFNEDNSFSIGDEIIGVVPAPQYSFMVSGLFPYNNSKYPDNGTFKSLGYEFEGAYHPDWEKELKRRIKKEGIEESFEDDENKKKDDINVII